MFHETYCLMAAPEESQYLYFPDGLGLIGDSCYYLMESVQPLKFGDDGYEVTDIRIRGLSFLILDLRRAIIPLASSSKGEFNSNLCRSKT